MNLRTQNDNYHSKEERELIKQINRDARARYRWGTRHFQNDDGTLTGEGKNILEMRRDEA